MERPETAQPASRARQRGSRPDPAAAAMHAHGEVRASRAGAGLSWGLAALWVLAYCAVLAWFAPLTLQDFPNHLARVAVMTDLIFHHGARFGAVFQYHFLAVPYILGDLFLVCAAQLWGIGRAALLWPLLVFLCLPGAVLCYLRAIRVPSDSAALVVILSVYLGTDWFFLVGFLEYRLAVAVTLLALGAAESWRRRQSAPRWVLYALVVALGYLTHLTALIFIAAITAAGSVVRVLLRSGTQLATEAALLLPCGLLLLWHFASGHAFRQPGDIVESPYVWGTVYGKFVGLGGELARFEPRADCLFALALLLCLALHVGPPRWRDFTKPRVLEGLVMAAAMLAMYAILPMGYSEAYYVDVRALPFACLFLVLALVAVPGARTAASPGASLGMPATAPRKGLLAASAAVWVASALALGNLVYLTRHLSVQSAWLNQYRAVVAAIPRNSWVLPVYTHAPEGKVVPFLHVYSFATLDRGAHVPYLQTGDTGNPQKYVRYRDRPYAPLQTWYGDIPAPQVDWDRVACAYDFLLVTRPFEPARLGVAGKVVFQNVAATLLALPPRAQSGARCSR